MKTTDKGNDMDGGDDEDAVKQQLKVVVDDVASKGGIFVTLEDGTTQFPINVKGLTTAGAQFGLSYHPICSLALLRVGNLYLHLIA
eukprot:scaffold85502_cov16-Prasinocladus_malaysianus.AAC.1